MDASAKAEWSPQYGTYNSTDFMSLSLFLLKVGIAFRQHRSSI